MADWKKNKLKFQMPHDRVERCMNCIKADKRAEAIRRAAFDKLLLERWKVRQDAKNGEVGHDG